jgi:hypothetical protein
MKYKRAYPEKNRARETLQRAVRRGLIARPTNCDMCGRQRKLDAHHEDYSQPLKVEWLCHQCHMGLHWFTKVAA